MDREGGLLIRLPFFMRLICKFGLHSHRYALFPAVFEFIQGAEPGNLVPVPGDFH